MMALDAFNPHRLPNTTQGNFLVFQPVIASATSLSFSSSLSRGGRPGLKTPERRTVAAFMRSWTVVRGMGIRLEMRCLLHLESK